MDKSQIEKKNSDRKKKQYLFNKSNTNHIQIEKNQLRLTKITIVIVSLILFYVGPHHPLMVDFLIYMSHVILITPCFFFHPYTFSRKVDNSIG